MFFQHAGGSRATDSIYYDKKGGPRRYLFPSCQKSLEESRNTGKVLLKKEIDADESAGKDALLPPNAALFVDRGKPCIPRSKKRGCKQPPKKASSSPSC